MYSAESLLNFMVGLAVFLCPIASIMATDYWLVKKRNIDIPGLYRRHGRYRYKHGINWRAVAALLSSLVPNLPGLASSVNKSLEIPSGFAHIVRYLPRNIEMRLLTCFTVRHELLVWLRQREFRILELVVLLSCKVHTSRSIHI